MPGPVPVITCYDTSMDSREKSVLPWSKRVLRVALLVCCTLAIPLVGKMLGFGVNWSAWDFMLMGALLACAGLAYEGVVAVAPAKYRIVVALAIMLILGLIWVEIAVGIFNTPIAGN